MSIRYVQTFRVIPKTPNSEAVFPLDMLRYDSCFFVNESDARALEANNLRSGGEIKLRRYVEHGLREAPTEARWSSFGWIINGEVETSRLP